MRKLVLITFVIAYVCAYPQKHNFNVIINELKSTDFPSIKTELSNGLKGRALDDCTLTALLNQDLMNLCADEAFAEVDFFVSGNYEPMDLPDENAGFTYTLVITYQGAINLTNGEIYDLSTLHRDGDVVVALDIATEHVNLTLPIAFNRLDVQYDYRAEIMGLGPSGQVEGHIDNLELSFKLSYDPTANQIHLDDFEVTDAGDIDVKFTGSTLIDWLLNLLGDVVTTVLKGVVEDLIHDVVQAAVQAAVDAINDALANGTTVAAPGLSKHIYDTLLEHKVVQ